MTRKTEESIMSKINAQCSLNDIEITTHDNGKHIKIHGLRVVNYYPFAANKTIFYKDAGKKGVKVFDVSPEDAVKYATKEKAPNKNNTKDTLLKNILNAKSLRDLKATQGEIKDFYAKQRS